MSAVVIGCFLAGGVWLAAFSPWTGDIANFWLIAGAGAALLGAYAWWQIREERARLFWFEDRWIAVGLVSAAVLYLAAMAGDTVVPSFIEAAQGDVDALYTRMEQAPRIVIGTLLLFLLAPAEELFWRGFVQYRLMQRYGDTRGWLVATALYTLVHIWAFNLMLTLALIAGGLLWGWLFKRYRRLWPVLISHAVWDVLIAVLLPLR